MATSALKGGPQLRARLASLAEVPKDMTKDWAEAVRQDMEGVHGRPVGIWYSTRYGKVYAPFWLRFIDRGTKAHDIKPQSISHSGRHWITSVDRSGPRTGYGKPKALLIGGTIFVSKVHKKRQAAKPFITKAAQAALRNSVGAPQILAAWSRRRGRGRGGKLEMTA